jgi:hypothetical protein
MQIVGCYFQHANEGFIRQRAGNTLLVGNSSFRAFGAPAIQIDGDSHGGAILGNQFYTKGPGIPIDVAASHVHVANNFSNQGDNDVDAQYRISGENVTVTGNSANGPPNRGIFVEGTQVTVDNNSIEAAGGDGFRLEGATLCSIGNNATRTCGGYGVNAMSNSELISLTGNVDAGSTGGGGTNLAASTVETAGNLSGSL